MTTELALARSSGQAAILREASKDLNPLLRLIVLGCLDHRADPAHVLRLGPSEAIVLRNPGGRVTRDVLRSLAVLSTIARIEGLDTGYDFLVLHHTDCGLSRLASAEHAALVSDFAGIGPDEVAGLALDNPRASSERDARLLASMVTSQASTVTGAVYDLDTGHVEVTYSEQRPSPARRG